MIKEPKVLYITKTGNVISFTMEAPEMTEQDYIKLFTYNEGELLMAKIAIEFLKQSLLQHIKEGK